MAEVAPVPAKKAAGAAKVRKPTGPSVTELLMQAVAASKDRGGISLAALKKSLAASGYDVEKNNSRLKLVLRSLVTKGTLLRIKGTGASGSFKLNKKRADPKDKATRKQQSAGAKNKKPTGVPKKAKRAAGAAGAKKAVKKPVSVAAKKPKSPAKLLKAKAKAKPKASTKAKPAPKKK
ncbi:histone H1-like [Pseudonaja textilis]|uniref:histone H1-like n=1 Tax=Pseudonaja textilis TaxID=8673 RepID=UPI000EA969C3|nr:histone H1-like [Pseudonaja textilis]